MKATFLILISKFTIPDRFRILIDHSDGTVLQ